MPLLEAPTLTHYLVLGAILFAISMAGIFLNRRNVILMLMAIELMLLAVNLNFIAFSRYLGDMAGQVFVFFILTVAAAESAIGLAIFVLLMAIELMLLAVNMNFVAFSYYLGDMHGQVFVFFILTVAAAEAAIGLAILVTLFRNRRTINVAELDSLKG